jgi:hypothetical protein
MVQSTTIVFTFEKFNYPVLMEQVANSVFITDMITTCNTENLFNIPIKYSLTKEEVDIYFEWCSASTIDCPLNFIELDTYKHTNANLLKKFIQLADFLDDKFLNQLAIAFAMDFIKEL